MRCTRSVVVAGALAVLAGGSAVSAGLPEYQAAVRSETSLVSYYTFDADAGTSVADTCTTALPDPSGAIAGSGTTFTAAVDALGGAGQALSLNGSGWVNFGQVAAFAFGTVAASTDGAVEMWIKPALADYGGINPALAAGGRALVSPGERV